MFKFVRNFILVFVSLILVVVLAYFVRSFYEKKVLKSESKPMPVQSLDHLSYDLIVTELELLKKQIERDILLRELQKTIGKEEFKKIMEEKDLSSLLSDLLLLDLFLLQIDEDIFLEEDSRTQFFALLQANREKLLKSKQQLTLMIARDGFLPFQNPIQIKKRLNVPFFLAGAGEGHGSAYVKVRDAPLTKFGAQGIDPVGQPENIFAAFITGSIKTLFDLVFVVVYNKEIFLIFGGVLGLVVTSIIFYSMHFR